MDNKTNFYFEVTYSLYVDGEDGKAELIEKTSNDRPYTFISGLGFALDYFENQLLQLEQDSSFNFTIPVDEAYGKYLPEHVLTLGKDIFMRDGKFDTTVIYPGAVLPMMNEDGNRLQGIVTEVRQDAVVMDFNHPLSVKALTFKGKIIAKRPATEQEIQKLLNYTQCGCCGGHCESDCHGECKDGDGCHGGCKCHDNK